MNFSVRFARKLYAFSFFLILISAVLLWQFAPRRAETAVVREKPAELSDYDIRTDETARGRIEKFLGDAGKTESLIALDRKRFVRAEQNLLAGGAKLKIEYSADLQTPETIAPEVWEDADFLTAPSTEKRADVLRNFLKRNSELIGLEDAQINALRTTADYTNPDGNLSFVHFEQSIGGVPVFRGEIKAGFSRKNEIVRIVNNLAPNLNYESLSTDFGNAEQAIENAAKFVDAEPLAGAASAEKMYFPVASGAARTAWRVLLETPSDAFYVIVDAQDGALLWRKKLTENQTQSATYEVYGSQTSISKTGDSPSPYTPGCLAPTGCPQPPAVARQSFTLIGNEAPYQFNNNGWIPDGENRTIGNNAEAGIDRVAPNGIDPDGWAFGNPNRNFVYVYNPAPGIPPPGEEPLPGTQVYPPSQFQQGTITHAFYTVNRFHDEMYRLGFTEQARNFQNDNFGRGGIGNDSISVEVQDGSGTNGANFFTGADGNRGRVQMFIWTGPTPDRDGGLDSQVLVHEITHGVSNRLHGNASGLSTNMSRGMGEGWSDFYSLALLSEPADDALGTYAVGGYITYQLSPTFESNYYYGIRRFPTAIMASVGANGKPHNPLTFKYLNGNCDTFIGTTTTNPNSAFPRNPVVSTSSAVQACDQVHNAGELWNVTLWEVRNQLIERHGAVEGNRRALQYITDGMKLAPVGPTMLQERDAIVAAAMASDPGDVLPVRRGFAIRGMGYYASIQTAGTGANNALVTESFEPAGNAFIGNGFAVSDAPGDNDGFPEPGESILFTVPLTNDTGATLTGVSVQIPGGNPVSYGDIANGQTVTRQIPYTVPANAPCGGNFPITFNISSSAGTRSETRSITVGTPIGGAPQTFTNSTALTLNPIGASTPYGTTLNVSGLTGLSKRIKLELTGLNHTYPGDLDVLLVGPSGQKFIALSDAISSFTTQTNANVVLVDNAPTVLPATGTTNMNGNWKPTNHDTTTDNFPAPAPASPYLSPAPAGTATFETAFGTNTPAMNGTWTLYINDDVSGDGGTLAGWKLTFESTDYLCCSCPRGERAVVSSCEDGSLAPVCTCVPPRSRADFDGDGKSDVSVFRPSEGIWYLNQSTAGFAALNWGLSGDKLVPNDYDGDNKTDFAVFRATADSSQPDFYVLRSSNFTYAGYSWGLPGDIPAVEDYDGDFRADLAIYRPSNHTFYTFGSNLGNVQTFSNIETGNPAPGDYDGDGKGDFATHTVNGFYISRSSSNFTGVSFIPWGMAGDKAVPADYDGDGKDDLAVFRPADRVWYIQNSGGGTAFVQFGLPDDVLVPGDYDGDRKADIAVYRNGIWYVNRSTAGMMITQFGLSGDLPIATGYLP
jgi:subtilisin-like proprotein convertase family protein